MRPSRVYITSGFLLLLIAVTILAGPGTTLAFLFAAGVHELGHIAALRLFGARMDRFRLGASGAQIVFTKRLSYAGEIAAALSGPLAGAMLAGASVWAGRRWGTQWLFSVAAVSALYTMVNLIPASPTDGGRALDAALNWAFGPDTAYRVGSIVDAASVAAAVVGGIYVFCRTGKNLSALISSFFLLNGCCKCRKFSVKSKHPSVGHT